MLGGARTAALLPRLKEGVSQQCLSTGSDTGVWLKSSEEEGLGLC